MAEDIVDWKVFTAWVETEGSVDSTVVFRLNPNTGNYSPLVARAILIPQVEEAPLLALQRFLDTQRIYSKMQFIMPSKTSFSNRPYYRLAIQRLEDIDAVISKIKSFVITTKTTSQIDRYLHLRHMNASELRAKFLNSWLESQRLKTRRGRKGQIVY
jgi:hypothetical protein